MGNKKEDKCDNDAELLKSISKEDAKHNTIEKENLTGDYGNIAILLFLYILQGVPMGILYAVPMLLQNRGVSYKEQAGLSFSNWPFALKLLWAPIIDSLYVKRFGRRKSWLVPSQLLIGIFMIVLSYYIDDLMGEGDGNKPKILPLTMIFFVLCFLAATQDVVVDGWALTMLKRCNIGHAATTNSVGYLTGNFIGLSLFIVLEAKKIVSFSQFLVFFGILFVISTIILAIFKKENHESDNEHIESDKYGIVESYSILKNIITKKPVLQLSIIILTIHVMFAACHHVTTLKLIDHGVPRDKLALMIVFIFPIEVVMPFLISKYITGPRPFNIALNFIPFSLLLIALIAGFVYATPWMLAGRLNNIPIYYYAIYVLLHGCFLLTRQTRSISITAFFARVSDPRFGGTYMTLLNTISNFGAKWTGTLMLWLVDNLTWQSCVVQEETNNLMTLTNNTCSNKMELETCGGIGGSCKILFDGYYFECIMSLVYGVIWFFWARVKINRVQNIPLESWRVEHKSNKEIELT